MAVGSLNGRPPRKQLSDQLNRLDGILDTLADGLPEAVGDAVRTGTQAALQQLLIETLTNPETLALLRAALVPPVAAQPIREVAVSAAVEPANPNDSFVARCRRRCRIRSRSLRAAASRGLQRLKAFVRGCRAAATQTVVRAKAVCRGLNFAWQLKKAALIGLGIGAAVVAVSLVSHPLAAVLSGVGAATTAFALQVGLWFRRTARQMIG